MIKYANEKFDKSITEMENHNKQHIDKLNDFGDVHIPISSVKMDVFLCN